MNSRQKVTPARSSSARLEAARQLDENEERDAYVGLSRKDAGTNALLERGVRDLVSCVTRWQRYLDFLIESFYRGDVSGIEKPMRTVLRMGIYELLFTRKPDHAVLNESVETAKVHVRPEAGSLTNGLLRNILRKRDSLPEPSGSQVRRIAIRHSHPDWMVLRWIQQWGEDDTVKFLEHNNQRPVFGVHILSEKEAVLKAIGDAGAEWESSPFLADFIRVRSIQPLLRGGFFKRGAVRIQDEAAALVVKFVDPHPGSQVLDLCAAPGSKTTLLALLLEESGRVVAADIHKRRLRLVRQNVALSGVKNVEVEVADGVAPPASWKLAFDHVLLDAPCTGFGVLGKRADMRWRRTESDLSDLIALQRKLMDGAASCVKVGGILTYSTCSVDPEENEAQVTAFLKDNVNFSLEDAPSSFPPDLLNEGKMYLSLPFKTDMDGAFAARLLRNS